MSTIRHLLSLSSFLILCTVTMGADWPQWLGPDRASEWREEGVKTSFAENKPTKKWSAECSYGYAGPAVADGKVYLFDYQIASGDVVNSAGRAVQLEGQERLLCFDAKTGERLWENAAEVPYKVSYPGGPRATPTVDGDQVYTLGTEGDLTCRRTTDGQPVWHVNFKQEFGVETPNWGHCSAPLIVGDLLYSIVGGDGSEVVAFNKSTGEEAWRALSSGEPGYSSPVTCKIDGVSRLLVFHPVGVSALDLETGKEIWTKKIEPDYRMSIAPPRLRGDQMFVSGGHKSMLLDQATSSTPSILWRGTRRNSIYCANSIPYFAEGVIFGCDASAGSLMAVDPKTGDRLWETRDPVVGPEATRRVDHGTVFLVRHTPSDRYFLFNERGELIVAELTREGFTQHGRMKILEPTNTTRGRPVVWTHPAFANQCVFARNDKELVCVDLAAE